MLHAGEPFLEKTVLMKFWIFDNDDLRTPFRQVAVFQNGQHASLNKPLPTWLQPLLSQ